MRLESLGLRSIVLCFSLLVLCALTHSGYKTNPANTRSRQRKLQKRLFLLFQ
ncbi:hypothetical protein PRUPE_7G139300 [Prunus persica]|uniref:Uncharacterized protein n=1 Tax=Prunus persica TaxID=3760 RepID=A0A251NB90_PRUPE|nr:hypothetical protein PRUPE_7G139300 [Prunus persica]